MGWLLQPPQLWKLSRERNYIRDSSDDMDFYIFFPAFSVFVFVFKSFATIDAQKKKRKLTANIRTNNNEMQKKTESKTQPNQHDGKRTKKTITFNLLDILWAILFEHSASIRSFFVWSTWIWREVHVFAQCIWWNRFTYTQKFCLLLTSIVHSQIVFVIRLINYIPTKKKREKKEMLSHPKSYSIRAPTMHHSNIFNF